jgi:ankyrin repeat protein
MSGQTEPLVESFKAAFERDDARSAATLLQEHPELQAKINEPIGAFDAPLITRVRSREMLDLLLSAGADINAKSRWWAGGFGLLHSAPPEVARCAIERGALVDAHAAARLGLLDKLRQLISERPAVVREGGGDGQTPLHFASTIPIAEYLLNHGADIDARDVDHESTPAQYMVRDRQEVARYLVGRGCKTDLLMATALGNVDLVRQHLDENPASVRMSVSERFFPKKNPRSGGTIYIWTLGQYRTAHGIAREFGHEQILQLLMERSPDELQLTQACLLGDEPSARELLARRPGLLERLSDEERKTLVYAAQHNDGKAVKLMLGLGWPVDLRGQHGGTALHWAAFHGNAEMAEALLASHSPLEWTDSDFHGTPLGWAIHGSENGWNRRTGNYPATVEALLRAGAQPPSKIAGSAGVQQVLERFAAPDRR